MKEKVVVLGASNKEERYSYKAFRLLLENGHTVIPVHPKLEQIDGIEVVHDLSDIKDNIDTITVYLAPERSEKLIGKLMELKPRRIITNPGTESEAIEKAASQTGIEVIKACTLVMLRTEQF